MVRAMARQPSGSSQGPGSAARSVAQCMSLTRRGMNPADLAWSLPQGGKGAVHQAPQTPGQGWGAEGAAQGDLSRLEGARRRPCRSCCRGEREGAHSRQVWVRTSASGTQTRWRCCCPRSAVWPHATAEGCADQSMPRPQAAVSGEARRYFREATSRAQASGNNCWLIGGRPVLASRVATGTQATVGEARTHRLHSNLLPVLEHSR